jgi:hypothetical protein
MFREIPVSATPFSAGIALKKALHPVCVSGNSISPAYTLVPTSAAILLKTMKNSLLLFIFFLFSYDARAH